MPIESEELNIPINLDTGKAEKEIDNLDKKIKEISGKDVEIDVDADVSKVKNKVEDVAEKSGKVVKEKISKGLKEAGESSEGIFDNLKNAFSDVSGLISGVVGGAGFGLITSGFEAIAGSVGEAYANANEFNSALLDIQAKTGATAEEMKVLEENARTAFLGGVGESVAEATRTIGQAQVLLGDTFQGAELGDFTAKAQALGNLFDKDVNEVISKATPFIKQFGLSSDEAFNLLAKGLREGQTPSDDLLDTFAEYSQLAANAGFSAAQFTGILTNGAEAGIFNLDKLADSIKETEIRLKAGDIGKALGEIGGDTAIEKNLIEQIKNIEQAGSDGILSVQEVLNESTKLINDALLNEQIGETLASNLQVAIAGTPAEDIGTELFGKIFSAPLDEQAILSSAQQIGSEVSNAVGQYTEFDKFNRELSLFVTDTGKTLIEGLNSVLGFLADNFDKIAITIGVVATALAGYSLVANASAIASGVASTATAIWNGILALNPAVQIALAVGALTAGVLALADAMSVSTEEQLENNQAQIEQLENQKKLNLEQQATEKKNQDLIESYKKLGENTKRTAEEQKEYERVQVELAKTYPGVIDSSKDFTQNMNALNDELQNSQNKVKGLIDEYGNLQKEQQELAKKQLGLKIQLAEESAFESFEGFLNLGGGNLKRLFNNAKNKILKEWDGSGLQSLGTQLQIDAFNDLERLGASDKDINAFQAGLQEIIELQKQRIVANGGVIDSTEKNTEAVEENTKADIKNKEGKKATLDELIKQLAILKISNKENEDSYKNLFKQAKSLADEEIKLKKATEGVNIELGLAESKGNSFAGSLEKIRSEQEKVREQIEKLEFDRIVKDGQKLIKIYDDQIKEIKDQEKIELNDVFNFDNEALNDLLNNLGGFNISALFIEDDIDKVQKRADEIIKILEEQAEKKRKIAEDEANYNIKTLEKKNKREEEERKKAFEKLIRDSGFNQNEIEQLTEAYNENERIIRENNAKQIEDIETDKADKIKEINKKSLEEQGLIQEDASKQIDEFRKKQQELYQGLAEGLSNVFGDIATAIGEGGKDIKKKTIESIISAFEALIPALVAQITGISLAQPDSVLTFGATGFARAALLTALLKGIAVTARNSIGGLQEGGLVGTTNKRRGYRDTELRYLDPEEVVLSREAVAGIGLDNALYINKHGKLPTTNNIVVDTRSISEVMRDELRKAKLVESEVVLSVKDYTGGKFTIKRGYR